MNRIDKIKQELVAIGYLINTPGVPCSVYFSPKAIHGIIKVCWWPRNSLSAAKDVLGVFYITQTKMSYCGQNEIEISSDVAFQEIPDEVALTKTTEELPQ
jgi:hypothetical protein